MIRIVERSPGARAWRYRFKLGLYLRAESFGRWLRRKGAVLSWWGGERVHELSTGRARRG